MVERRSFDKLLEELVRLGPHQSKLIHPVLFLFLAVHHKKYQLSIISMRLDDIEKGIILDLSDSVVHSDKPILQQKKMLSKKIISILKNTKSKYPIRGRITDINQNQIKLNIGENHGVEIDNFFKVIGTDILLKVDSIESDLSICSLKSGNDKLSKQLKVSKLYHSNLK